jgi:hypothetical protein
MWLDDALKPVSNSSLCTWFYLMFMINLIFASIMVIRLMYLLVKSKVGLVLGSVTFLLTLVSVAVPLVNGAFFYALCDRSLNGTNSS